MKQSSRWFKVCAIVMCLAGLALAEGNGKDDGKKDGGSIGFGPSLVGNPAPAFTAKTIDGGEVDLSKEKGNVVLMDFWATWCAPCKASLPHVEAMSKDPELVKQGLKVWAVNCTHVATETEEKAREYVKEQGFTFTVPLDAEGLAAKNFHINLIPVSLVIGRDGKVKSMLVGFGPDSPDKLKAAVEAALKEKAE